MSHGGCFLFKNCVVSPAAETPPVAVFLERQPGVYTTTRTQNNGSELLFWDRHLIRLSNSFKLLLKENPNLLFKNPRNFSSPNRDVMWDSVIKCVVNDSVRKVVPVVVKERKFGEELSFTTLLSGNLDHLEGGFDEEMVSKVLDVYLHVGGYVPTVFGVQEIAARLAIVGRGRDFANAKYSDWVRDVMWDSVIKCVVNDSVRKAVPFVVKERKFGEELSFTTLLSGNLDHLEGEFDEEMICEALDVYLHVGGYVPSVFGVQESAARLAVMGRGRDFANAKYSDWVRLRKQLEKLHPPSVTELLLSNDGDRILEGCLTNFFVVSLKEKDGDQSLESIEVQTAPLSNGVLPGVIRQVIRDICLEIGIPFREVAPSWSKRELWMEAFITNSLRILQHVETIQAPNEWKSVESNTWEEITWVEKRFENGPGRITSRLQKEILKKAGVEAFPVDSLVEEGGHGE